MENVLNELNDAMSVLILQDNINSIRKILDDIYEWNKTERTKDEVTLECILALGRIRKITG